MLTQREQQKLPSEKHIQLPELRPRQLRVYVRTQKLTKHTQGDYRIAAEALRLAVLFQSANTCMQKACLISIGSNHYWPQAGRASRAKWHQHQYCESCKLSKVCSECQHHCYVFDWPALVVSIPSALSLLCLSLQYLYRWLT